MFQPSWRGTINCKLGLYNSNPNRRNTTIDATKTDTTKTDTTKTDTTKTDTTNNDDDNTNLDIKHNNYNFNTYKIPYYNVNSEYLQNNINNQDKDNTNYYNLLDRIGYISRYLLKGNDYYRLYISKNSNKYFSNDNDDTITMTNPMNDKFATTMNDTSMNDATMNDATMNDISYNSDTRNNKYINKNDKK